MKLFIIMVAVTLTYAEIDFEENSINIDPWEKTRTLSIYCDKNPSQMKVREYFNKFPGSYKIHGVVDGTSLACVTMEDQELYNVVLKEREPIINDVQCYTLPCPECFKSIKGCKQLK